MWGGGYGWGQPYYADSYYVADYANPCTTPWLYANPRVACQAYMGGAGPILAGIRSGLSGMLAVL